MDRRLAVERSARVKEEIPDWPKSPKERKEMIMRLARAHGFEDIIAEVERIGATRIETDQLIRDYEARFQASESELEGDSRD